MTTATRVTVGRPGPDEAIPYYSRYFELVPGHDPMPILEAQLATLPAFFTRIGEQGSLHRYAADK